jgi:hypothetical protein
LNKPTNGDYYETLEDFQKYRETSEFDTAQKKHRVYVYFGDQKGFVNVLDLTSFLKKRDIQDVMAKAKSDNYQLRRKEWMDCTKIVENHMSSMEKTRKPFYTVHTFNSLLHKRWEAHSMAVTSMSKVSEPPSFITCS